MRVGRQWVRRTVRLTAVALLGVGLFVGARPALAADGTAAGKPATQKLDPEHAANMAKGLALFKSDVRKILIDQCVDCHGGKKTKGELDLTTRKKLLEGGFEAEGIVPGDHGKSHLYKLIAHQQKPHMPHKKPKLPDAVIAKIARWIDLGAPYDKPLVDKSAKAAGPMQVTDKDRKFWSFAPLMPWAPPALRPDGWSRTPIDRFILSKLRAQGLTPSPIVDRRTLIRRAYFDLIGLPPTPEQVDAFVNDPDPKAYEKLIDKLLASPHYGERWARHWLDVARFAESHGYEQDYDRPYAYHYRDFVIKALNQDMPFDQFVRWQLAGDEIAPDNPLAMMATGFMGAGVFPTQLTEKEFESSRYDELDDMVSTMGTSMLGLTIGCARCHDHKYDPIPTRDYYRMIATFATTIRSEIDLNLSTPQQRQQAKAAYETKLKQLEAARTQFEREQLPKLFGQYVASLKAPAKVNADAWSVLDIASIKTANGTRFEKQPDGSLLRTGKTPATDTYTFVAHTDAPFTSAVRLEALTHKSLPRNGPGLAGNGNFCLSDFTVTAAPRDGSAKPVAVTLVAARVTHEQNKAGLSARASFDADKKATGWAVDAGGIGKDQAAVFVFEKPVGFKGGTTLTLTLRFDHPNAQHAIGRPRLAVTGANPQTVAIRGDDDGGGMPARVAKSIRSLARGENQPANLRQEAMQWYATTLPQWRKLKTSLDNHRNAGPAVSGKKTKVMVASEGLPHMKHHADGRGFPHFYPKTYFLHRGDVNQKGDIATQGFLQVLMRDGKRESNWQVAPPKGWRTSYRRTSLANWMTDTKHGAGDLLARVIVNRLWQHHMGRGIVATPNDFGFQGDRPTHPHLLDWLAIQLIRHDWKLKPMHKLIMTSAVYMQSSDYASHNAQIDPDNQWLWRRHYRRLEAEAIRDSMLAVAGQLDTTMFGKGTLDERMKRRSIYFFIKRSRLIPVLQLFDMPEPLVSQGRRPATTIAPQALMFLNSPIVRDYATSFAARLAPRAKQSLDAAVTEAYRLALNRKPTATELADDLAFIKQQAASYKANGKANAQELALADLGQVLMSLNEFVYPD